MLDYLGDVVGGEVKVGGAHDVLQADACDLIGHVHMELHLWRCGVWYVEVWCVIVCGGVVCGMWYVEVWCVIVCGGVVCDSVWRCGV